MASPITFEVPHSLGKDEARRRMAAGVPKLASRIPGGAEVQSSWPTQDQLDLQVTVMGQTVTVQLLAKESAVVASVDVPFMLAMMSGPIVEMVKNSAQKSLEGPSPDDKA